MSNRRPTSSAFQWPALGFVAAEHRLALRMARTRAGAFAYEFIRFGVKQAWACLFGGIMLELLLATHWVHPAPLARYDFLTIAAVVVQALMLATGLETRAEARVIVAFHVAGTAMEVFNVSVGSWIYPEPSVLHIAGVPLFTGFMHASVGSYIARAWRVFDIGFVRRPSLPWLCALTASCCVNFFTHHYAPDIRWALFAAAALLLGRSWLVLGSGVRVVACRCCWARCWRRC